jgi:hypothetical protein
LTEGGELQLRLLPGGKESRQCAQCHPWHPPIDGDRLRPEGPRNGRGDRWQTVADDTMLAIVKQLGERGVEKVHTRHGNLAVGKASGQPFAVSNRCRHLGAITRRWEGRRERLLAVSLARCPVRRDNGGDDSRPPRGGVCACAEDGVLGDQRTGTAEAAPSDRRGRRDTPHRALRSSPWCRTTPALYG